MINETWQLKPIPEPDVNKGHSPVDQPSVSETSSIPPAPTPGREQRPGPAAQGNLLTSMQLMFAGSGGFFLKKNPISPLLNIQYPTH